MLVEKSFETLLPWCSYSPNVVRGAPCKRVVTAFPKLYQSMITNRVYYILRAARFEVTQ